MDEIYQKMLKEKLDYTSIYKGGVDAGFNLGISEGKNNEKIEIAKNMLEEKVDVDLISKYTNLSIEEIKALR